MSLRDLLKRYLPEQHRFREHRHIRLFGGLLHDHGIWRLTRRSVSGGVAIGLFCAMLPIFGQMPIAAALAIYFRVNLPIAITFTWASNPLTFPALFYIIYRIGAGLLDMPVHYMQFQLSYEWFSSVLHQIWLPVLVGSLILGVLAAATGYYTINILWRILLLRKRDERRVTRPFMRRLLLDDEADREEKSGHDGTQESSRDPASRDDDPGKP